MRKQERLNEILNLVNKMGTVYVQDIMESMNVSDMTVRRDLIELEEKGFIIRIRNGATTTQQSNFKELPHEEKLLKNIILKRQVAKKAINFIEEGDTIFLGPGTSIEFLAEEITTKELRVITNCLPIFQELSKKKSDTFKVILLGGEIRDTSQAFVGEIPNSIIGKMYFNKMFFSGNGIADGLVKASSFDEAYTQKKALERSTEGYLLIDSSKIGKEDFTSICSLSKVTAIITDDNCEDDCDELKNYTQVI